LIYDAKSSTHEKYAQEGLAIKLKAISMN